MLIKHQGKQPDIHETAYVAPNAVICGDVTIGENTQVLFGAIIVGEGGSVIIGSNCIIMENAVIRGTPRHPTSIGNNVLVGPHSHLSGCSVDECTFLGTGSSIFNGAKVGKRVEVRINGVVHLKTVLPDDSLVPIAWVAVGDPAKILPPDEHDNIWETQAPLDFPKTVFGLARSPTSKTIMPEVTDRYSRYLSRHKADEIIDEIS